MKNLFLTRTTFARLGRTVCVTLFGLVLLLAAVSCRKESAGKPADVDYYTCTMHPSVKKQSPTDKCPICSMDLEPVKKKGAPAGHDHGQTKSDAKSMGMSAEEQAKMQTVKGKDDMKGMPGMK